MNKFAELESQMNDVLVDRHQEVRLALLGWLTRNNTLLIGEPGTGKTMLAHMMARSVEGKVYHNLFHDATRPEDVYGPSSFKSILEDRHRYVTTDTIVDADFAVLDEAFNASASSRSLHSILNERRFKNGTEWVECPLQTCIGTGNHWPMEASLKAAFDRYLLRALVQPARNGLEKLLFEPISEDQITVRISKDEVAASQEEVRSVRIEEEVRKLVNEIIDALESAEIRAGDRRMRKSIEVVKASAYLGGREEAGIEDCLPLRHILWNDPINEMPKAIEIITSMIDPESAKIPQLQKELAEIRRNFDSAFKGDDMKTCIEISKSAKDILRESEAMRSTPGKQLHNDAKKSMDYIMDCMVNKCKP